MASSESTARTRRTLVLMNAIVVLQPVRLGELEQLSPDAEHVVKYLQDAGLVHELDDKTWVATGRGLRLASTKELGRKRDILRMFQLVERSKGG